MDYTTLSLALAAGLLIGGAVSSAIFWVREWALKRNHDTERRDSYRHGYRAGLGDGMKRKLQPIAPHK